jgi:hypothetical protein
VTDCELSVSAGAVLAGSAVVAAAVLAALVAALVAAFVADVDESSSPPQPAATPSAPAASRMAMAGRGRTA